MTRKIVTNHMFPPIPVRDYDWCAYYVGEEEAGDYGWGRTEAEAILDFLENHADDHNERLSLPAPPYGWAWTLVPAYPEGEVKGPCVCGSWPGGECLKCPPLVAPNPVPGI